MQGDKKPAYHDGHTVATADHSQVVTSLLTSWTCNAVYTLPLERATFVR